MMKWKKRTPKKREKSENSKLEKRKKMNRFFLKALSLKGVDWGLLELLKNDVTNPRKKRPKERGRELRRARHELGKQGKTENRWGNRQKTGLKDRRCSNLDRR